MPRSKAKQEELNRRNETYREDAEACATCRHCHSYFGQYWCEPKHLAHRGSMDHMKSVQPYGWCVLWEGKVEP